MVHIHPGDVMKKPTSDERVKRIKTLEKKISAEAELQYRLKFQHLITAVSSRFINLYPAQIDDEIERTLQQIGIFADADRSYVFQFSEDHKTVSCTHEWC
jgi:hypothetical protein